MSSTWCHPKPELWPHTIFCGIIIACDVAGPWSLNLSICLLQRLWNKNTEFEYFPFSLSWYLKTTCVKSGSLWVCFQFCKRKLWRKQRSLLIVSHTWNRNHNLKVPQPVSFMSANLLVDCWPFEYSCLSFPKNFSRCYRYQLCFKIEAVIPFSHRNVHIPHFHLSFRYKVQLYDDFDRVMILTKILNLFVNLLTSNTRRHCKCIVSVSVTYMRSQKNPRTSSNDF